MSFAEDIANVFTCGITGIGADITSSDTSDGGGDTTEEEDD